MSTWIEIQRLSGLATGACPGCGADPFLVVGSALPRIDPNVMRSGAVAKCCGDPVGSLANLSVPELLIGGVVWLRKRAELVRRTEGPAK